MVNSAVDITNYVISNLEQLVGTLSDYEKSIISESVLMSYKEVGNNKIQIMDSLDKLASYKSGINYILLKVRSARKSKLVPYNEVYNKYFTIISHQNKMISRQAVDAEIKYTHPDLSKEWDEICKFDDMIEYLETQFSIIDLIIRNLENRKYMLS